MNFEEKESGVEDELKKLGYWNNLYAKNDYFGTGPTILAVYAKKILDKYSLKNILELGCGQGRDSIYFAKLGYSIVALDLSENAIKFIEKTRNDENLKDNKDLDKIIDSIEIVKKDLISIFKKNGIEAIECINKKFDPNFHQAMLEVENNTKETGTVVQEIQKGYMMKDRLLRPSLVGVAKKIEEKKEKK